MVMDKSPEERLAEAEADVERLTKELRRVTEDRMKAFCILEDFVAAWMQADLDRIEDVKDAAEKWLSHTDTIPF